MAGTVPSFAHLSVAGSAAADAALALGKVRYKFELTSHEQANLQAVAESFRNYSYVFGHSASYLAVVARQRPTDTLAEVAVAIEGYNDEKAAAERFEQAAGEIHRIADGEDIDTDSLSELHTLFRKMTKHIDLMLSASGERPLQNSLR